MKWFKHSLPEILLILIIPLLTAGLSWFESTSIYGNLIGINGIDYAAEYKLRGLDFATSSPQYRLQPTDPEFKNVWRIIKTHSPIIKTISTSYQDPDFITIYIPQNSPFVGIPFNGQIKNLLIMPDTAPLIVGFCYQTPDPTTSQCYFNNEDKHIKNLFIAGNLADLKTWTQEQTDWWRSTIDTSLAIISVMIGCLYLYFKKRR